MRGITGKGIKKRYGGIGVKGVRGKRVRGEEGMMG
jgi:hypothetical protein